jgi:hypothetical protein
MNVVVSIRSSEQAWRGRMNFVAGKTLTIASFYIAKEGAYSREPLEQAMQKDVKQTKIDEQVKKKKLDMELDRELEATFPASDALKITRTDTQTRFSRQNRRM